MVHEPPTDLRALWDFDDPGGSEERFRDVVRRTTGKDRQLALTQVARALGLLGRFDEGHAVLDALDHDHADADAEVAVRGALERGRLLRSSGDPSAARAHLTSAAERAGSAGLEELQVDALHMLALVAPPDEQESCALRALDVARHARDPRARDWDASLLNNLGMTYADAGDFARALETFEEALRARERIGDPATTRVARWMVAWALRNLGRTEEARRLQLALREELRAVGGSDAYVEEELALLGSPDDGDRSAGVSEGGETGWR